MFRQPGTAARPAAYTALLLALSVLVSLLLPLATAGTAYAAGAAPVPVPESSGPSGRTAVPTDADPEARARGEKKQAEQKKEQQAGKADGKRRKAAQERAARLKESGAKALARAEAEGVPAPAECAALPLASFGDPGSAVGRVSVPGYGNACFVFTAERAGMHRVLLGGAPGLGHLQVFDGETALNCSDGTAWGDNGWCDLPRTGAFTLRIVNRDWDEQEFLTTVVPVGAGTAGCLPTVGTALGTPPAAGSSPSPLALICQPFTARPGERIVTEVRTERYGWGDGWITDDSGRNICPVDLNDGDDNQGCVLPGTGPYRFIARVTKSEGGFPAAYRMGIHRLSQPEGCATVPVNSYGSAPTPGDPGVGCKIFTATAAGHHELYAVSGASRTKVRVYDGDGRTVCEPYRQPCALTPGTTYTLHTGADTLVLNRASDSGCEPVAAGTPRGSLAAPASADCLTLPFPEGASIAVNESYAADELRTDTMVFTADGGYVCDWTNLRNGTCKLTGKAPFRAIVSAEDASDDEPTLAYSLSLIRTDDPAGCRVLPAGDFTDRSPSVPIRTGGGSFAECLAIPAADHSAGEIIQLRTLTGTPNRADLTVIRPNGTEVCSIDSAYGGTWASCALAPGTAYTVLFGGRDEPAAFTVTRRDITGSAKGCAAAPVTAVGGPSTGGVPAERGSMVCRQVGTGSAEDALYLNVRDAQQALLQRVFRADGSWVDCGWSRLAACAATGSTTYQVVLSVPAGKQKPDTYRYDALRIRSGNKPAPECVTVPNVSYGYGPVTGVLDERRTAYCAALPTAVGDRFRFDIEDTAGGTATTVPALYNTALASSCTRFFPSGYECAVNGSGTRRTPEPTLLVLGLPEEASTTSYRVRLDCSYAPCGSDAPTVTGVAPLTGASDSKVTVQISGGALRESDRIRLSARGRTVESTTVSVAPDRRTLTALLDLTGVPVGAWSMSVLAHGMEFGMRPFTVTAPQASVNTKAPSVGGTARVGARLTARPGVWSPVPSSFSYQWRADGQPIAGATGSAYTVPAALLGKRVGVAVTAHRTGAPVSKAVSSAAVTVGKGVAPKASKTPVVSGRGLRNIGTKTGAKPRSPLVGADRPSAPGRP